MNFPELYPTEEHDEFMNLKPDVREKVWWLYDAARTVFRAGPKQRVATCRELAAVEGMSWKAVYEPTRAFLATQDWRVLVDRRRHPELWVGKTAIRQGLPAEFLSCWHDMVVNQHRCIKTAYTLLLQRLAAWRKGDMNEAIPGYVVPPQNAKGRRHPQKWSYRDLCRNAPPKVEQAAKQHGRAAAMQMFPSVRTTRMGGYPGMEFQFDDRWIDVEAIYGNRSINRILEFAGVEFYSGYHFSPWLRPRLNLDGVNKSLSERDFRLFAVSFAATVGWSPQGSVYRGERGLCAFRAGLDEKLRRHSNGRIEIAEPGMSGQAAYVGGFAELAKGNPNAKALKEGMGGFLHNLLGGVLGQSGSCPADKPAAHVGRERETLALLALQGAVARPLTLAHHTFEQVCAAIFQIYEIANLRTDHHSEGWLEEGLVTEEFCADVARDIWIPVNDLSGERRAALAVLAGSLGDMLRPRSMSPAEVLRPALPGFCKLSPAAIADCIYDDVKRKVTVTAGEVSFQDVDGYGPGRFRYPARFQRHDGFTRTLPNGEELYLVVHPALPETGYFFSPDGRLLGRAQRDHAARRADADAIKRRIGKKVALFNDATLALQVREGLKRERDLTDNAATLIDGIRSGMIREAGLGPQRERGPVEVSISELLDTRDDFAEDDFTGDEPAMDTAMETAMDTAMETASAMSILLGTE